MSNVIGFKAYKNTLKRDSGYAPVSGENGYSVIRCVFPAGGDWDNISAVSAGFFVHPKNIADVTAAITAEGEERAALFTIPGALLKQGERLHFGLFATVGGVTIATNTVALDVERGIVSDDIDYDPAEAAGMFEQFSNALNTALLGKANKAAAGSAGELAALDGNGSPIRSGVSVKQSIGGGSNIMVPTTAAVKNALDGKADKLVNGDVAFTDRILIASNNGGIKNSGYTINNARLSGDVNSTVPSSNVVAIALEGKADKAADGTDGELAALDANGALIRSGVSVTQSVDAGGNSTVPTTEAVKTALNGKADKAPTGAVGELAAFDGVGALKRSGLTVAQSVGVGSDRNVPTTAAVKLALDGKADKAPTGAVGELAAVDGNGALIRSGVSVTQSVDAGGNSTVPTTEAVKTALNGKADKLSSGGGGELVSATGGGKIQRSGFFATQSIGNGAANMLPTTEAVKTALDGKADKAAVESRLPVAITPHVGLVDSRNLSLYGTDALGFYHTSVPVEEGERYIISCRSSGNVYPGAFYTLNGAKVSSIFEDSATHLNVTITVPSGVDTLWINSKSTIIPLDEWKLYRIASAAEYTEHNNGCIVTLQNEREDEAVESLRRLKNLETLFDFRWKPFDKAYYCFVNEGTKAFIHVFYDVFHAHGMPLVAAAVGQNVELMNDTQTNGGRTVKQTLDAITADGGEIMVCLNAGELKSTDPFEMWYEYAVKNGKHMLEAYGYTVRGLILSSQSARNSAVGQQICERFFDYADNVGIKSQYDIECQQFSGSSTVANVKAYIDATVNTPGFYPIVFHRPSQEPWASAEGMDEILTYIESFGSKAAVSTYSHVFDEFGTIGYALTPQDKAEIAGMVDISGKADKATTLAGYGITDAYTKTQTDTFFSDTNADIADLKAYIGYTDGDILGLHADFENKVFTRLGAAVGLTAGQDFNAFTMYGQRRRVVVDSNGVIDETESPENITENDTNVDVMVYQPKFYYKVVPLKLEKQSGGLGYHIRKANYYISSTPHAGFKLHPLFYDANGNEVDYVLFSAYEASYMWRRQVDATDYINEIFHDGVDTDTTIDTTAVLKSLPGVKPISGQYKAMNKVNMENCALRKSSNWHLDTIQSVSANQLLVAVEYGTFNTQSAIGLGIVNTSNSNSNNCSSLTGSTSAETFNTASGMASETIYDDAGTETPFNTNGKVAVVYRGMENPWGNIWKHVNGINIWGDGTMNGGQVYIADNFNFNESSRSENYKSAGFTIANTSGYISAFGYGDEDYDWLFIPSETAGNSSIPVGDREFCTSNLSAYKIARYGGNWMLGNPAGAFCLDCNSGTGFNYLYLGGRLLYVPTATV